MIAVGVRAACAALVVLSLGAGAPAHGKDGLTRWAELVSDGNLPVVQAVPAVDGNAGKVTRLDAIMEVLAEHGHGISADLKDDESVELAIEDMNTARGLSGFSPPSAPAAGPGRCSATLLAYAHWVGARGYRLVPIDTRDDDWNAVLVKAAHLQELLRLSTALGIGTGTPEQAYAAASETRVRGGRRR